MNYFPGHFVKVGLFVCLFLLSASGSASQCVVLLHGLAQITNNMSNLETRLERSGYVVANIRYSWRSDTPQVLAEDAVARGISQCRAEGSQQINFVTHSFGGIMVRLYLEKHTLEKLGRVVMLAPPNRGSPLLTFLSHLPGFGLLGPSARALSTPDEPILHNLKPVNFELGVIAGSRNINPLSWFVLDGLSDGVITVESTRVKGMDEHLVLPVIHNTMMRKKTVIDHTIYYLKSGSFTLE